MKKPNLSEIKARAGNPFPSNTGQIILSDIPYLLGLVERLGKELGNQQCPACEKYFSDPGKPCAGCQEARALILEVKE